MSSGPWAVGVLHPCLASPARSLALAEARLTDRRKVAALLEAAGLLSLLDRAGWRLAAGWETARISPEGRLALGAEAAAPGRSSRPAQEILLDLIRRHPGLGDLDQPRWNLRSRRAPAAHRGRSVDYTRLPTRP